jgi:hypothetical protein
MLSQDLLAVRFTLNERNRFIAANNSLSGIAEATNPAERIKESKHTQK